MLANNLDVINLAIFEREEALRRQSRAIVIRENAAYSPWTALRARLGRLFGEVGGEYVGHETMTIASDAPTQPQPLSLIHLPASVDNEAIERAA